MTGFYKKCNSRLNGLKAIHLKWFPSNTCCILSLCSFKMQQSVTKCSSHSKNLFLFAWKFFLQPYFRSVLKETMTAKTSKSYEFYLIKLITEYFIISFCIFMTLFYTLLHFWLNSSRKVTPDWETFEKYYKAFFSSYLRWCNHGNHQTKHIEKTKRFSI